MRSVTVSKRCKEAAKQYPIDNIARQLFIENPTDKFLATNLFNCLYQLTNSERDDMKFNKFMKRLLERSEMVDGFKKLLDTEKIIQREFYI
jgi:hypothetical protein